MLSIEPSDMKHALEATQKEIHTLKDRLQTAQDELRQAEANVSQLKRKYGTHRQQGVGTCVCVCVCVGTDMLHACHPTPARATTAQRGKQELWLWFRSDLD